MVWLLPERRGLDPGYEQLAFPDAELRGKFHLVAGPQAPVTIHQDANLYIALRLGSGCGSQTARSRTWAATPGVAGSTMTP